MNPQTVPASEVRAARDRSAESAPRAYLNLIGGKWVPARSGKTFENRNPARPSDLVDLRELCRDDDLIDVEFVAICAARGYQVIEFSVPPLPRHSGASTTNVASAWHMYSGAFTLRRELARRGLLANRNR